MQPSQASPRALRRTAPVLGAVLSAVLLATLAAPASAQDETEVAQGPALTVEDGVTQPVFGYDDAIRERVFVTSDVDTDADGALDVVALDIMRPAATEAGHEAPVIMDASPYYATLGRGNDAELKADTDGDGLLDRWPLYYDNYFVPRGYAVVLMDMIGTASSTGCPTTGGTGDNVSAVVAIDWLNGRRPGVDAAGEPVVADWHNGRTGMIGKSYDGTLANAAAASGVEGLETIVPISAISSWYLYSRSNGIRFNTNYPASLSNTVTTPARRAGCAEVRATLSATDGDETGDYTPFWEERNYLPDADQVRASVFVVHGINDWNVKTDHLVQWWEALGANGVQRKLWLTGTGHIDPFDFRREEWVDTLHRWFDAELFGLDNGIHDEPQVDVERAPDVWETHASWPLPGTSPVNLFLQPGADGGPGGIGAKPARPGWETFTDRPSTSRAQAIATPQTPGPNRLVYLSDAAHRAAARLGQPAGEAAGDGGRDGHELRRGPRRLRRPRAVQHGGGRHPHADDRGLLGPVERGGRRLLPPDREDGDDPAAGDGHPGHPGRGEHRQPRDRDPAGAGRAVRLRAPAAARGLRLRGGAPDRCRHPGLVLRLPQRRGAEPRRDLDRDARCCRPAARRRWEAGRAGGRAGLSPAVSGPGGGCRGDAPGRRRARRARRRSAARCGGRGACRWSSRGARCLQVAGWVRRGGPRGRR